jgi:hypothetical protein
VHFLGLASACWIGIGAAYGQQTRPTDEDVDRAIRVCTVGQKFDAKVEGGLSVLKRRMVSGEGSISQSEIPSVIGTEVKSDQAKIQLFEMIQKCVVARVKEYGGGLDSVGPIRPVANGTVCCPLIGTVGTCAASESPLNSACFCEMAAPGGTITNLGTAAPPIRFQGRVCK